MNNSIRRLFAATLTILILGANLHLTNAAESAGIFVPENGTQESLSTDESMSAFGFTGDTAAPAAEDISDEEMSEEGAAQDTGSTEASQTAEDAETAGSRAPADETGQEQEAAEENAGPTEESTDEGESGEEAADSAAEQNDDPASERSDDSSGADGAAEGDNPSDASGAEEGAEDVPMEEDPQEAETAVETEPELKELVAEGRDFRIRVIYDQHAQIPEGTELVAGEYPEDSKEYIGNRQKLIEMLLDEEKAAQARRDASGVAERKAEAEEKRSDAAEEETRRGAGADTVKPDTEAAAKKESPASDGMTEDAEETSDRDATVSSEDNDGTEQEKEETSAVNATEAAIPESAEETAQETAEAEEETPSANTAEAAVPERAAEIEQETTGPEKETPSANTAEAAVPESAAETEQEAAGPEEETPSANTAEAAISESAAETEQETAGPEEETPPTNTAEAEEPAEDRSFQATVYEEEAPETEDGFTFDMLRQFDISLVADGVEIEPAEAVRVEIELLKVEVEEEISVLHFGEEATELFEGESAETTISEKPVSSTVAFSMDSFSDVTVWTGAWANSGRSYTVSVDPTNMNTRTYSSADIAAGYPNTFTNGRITLPTAQQVINPTAYYVDRSNQGKGGYRLNGWVDVNSKTWYPPGSVVQVSANMTFYADWVPATYDIGTASGVSGSSIDTDGFITTHVFDYSDLFNLPYASLVNIPGSGYPGWPGYQPPSTGWSQTSGNNLLLFDSTAGNSTLSRMDGRGSNAMDHSGDIDSAPAGADNYAIGVITPGIGTGTWLNRFFDPDNAMTVVQSAQNLAHNAGGIMGKTYVGTGNYLYSYDDASGYYYYDSSKNAASYNKSANRFYVYNYTEQAQPSLGRNESDFLPFNTGRSGSSAYNNTQGEVNYWFGMSTEIDFFLPNNPGARDPQTNTYGNRSISGDDMVYRFSGDDDVWVYVDDQLVLDMGGVHDVVYGEINFSTGEWMTVQATAQGNSGTGGVLRYDQNGVLSYVSGGRVTRGQLPQNILAGDHKLKMYYLERGASQSNAAIYFNIAPRYGLELTKWDSDHHSLLLPGAEFSVFLDAACTIPASLWDSKQDCDDRRPAKNVFTTSDDGTFYAYGLIAGYTYYLKETGIPLHYMTESDEPIALRLDNAGNVTLPQGETFVTVERDDAQKEIAMHVSNKPGIAVDVEKRWFYEDGSPMEEEDIPGSITVGLFRWPKPAGGGSGGGSTTLPDIRVPVNISTRYFDSVPNGYSNGHNMETGFVKNGDLTVNTTVQYGGSLRFTVNGTGGTAGVYSVVINGRRAEPVSRTNRSSEDCYIGGSWGNFPYRTEVYEVSDVTEGLQIQVQLIGYLGYEGYSPLVSRTIEIATEVTAPAQPEPPQPDPDPDPDPGQDEIPGTRPEDAELVDTQILSSENGWKYKWEDLEEGYYYYVEEMENDILSLYDVFYSGNGIETGAVVINNIQKPEPPAIEIEVEKVWSDGNENHPSPETITVFLLRDGERTGESLELHAGNDWHGAFTELPVHDETGRAYTYEVEEVAVEGYTSVVTGSAEDGYVITNTRLYVLPETGAGGTWGYTIYGCMLFLLGILLFAGAGKKTQF